VSAFGVLVAQPLDRLFDFDGALPFPEDHLAGVALDAEVEALATHRAKLGAHQPLHDHGRFLAALFALGFGHRAGYGSSPCSSPFSASGSIPSNAAFSSNVSPCLTRSSRMSRPRSHA
jgi:hypothetical protein